MNKTAKRVSLLMAAAMLAFYAAGCGGNGTPNALQTAPSSSTQVPAGQASSADAPESASPASEPPAELSVYWDSTPVTCDRPTTQLKSDIETATNTKLTFIEAPSGEGATKLNLLVTSGDIPDIIKNSVTILNKYGVEGALQDMEAVMDQYMPTAKTKINADAIKKLKASDNVLYIAPTIRNVGGSAYYVRQDWLDKLGMSKPTTLDEYYNMLKAFTLDDPDGNGARDTYGTTLSENFGRFELISGPFGLPPFDFIQGEDGNLVHSSVTPGMKEALAFGVRLAKEGLMDPEFSTTNAQIYNEKVAASKFGLVTTSASLIPGLVTTIQSSVPDAKLQIIDVPVAPGVTKGVASVSQIVEGTGDRSIAGQAAISSTTKNLEAAAKFLDWTYTDEAMLLFTFGTQGRTYTMENDVPTYMPEYAGTAGQTQRQAEGLWDMLIIAGSYDQGPYFPQIYDADTASNIAYSLKSSFPKLVYFSTPTGDTAAPEIDNARKQYFTQILMGSLDLESGWTQWMDEFKRLGGDKWTQEVNDIYKSR